MKQCSNCKTIKPFEQFSKDKQKKDGLRYNCKACCSLIHKSWNELNQETKSAKEKEWREKNKIKCKEYRKEYYETNKSESRKKASEYEKRERIKNPKKYSEKSKRYRDKNPLYLKSWHEKNPSKSTFYTSKRRAAKLTATPPWLDEILLAQIQWYYAAAKMMTETSGVIHHVDHIHPLQGQGFSGLHVPWNLQVIPASENIKKNNKLILLKP
jgi:hypothetical protein